MTRLFNDPATFSDDMLAGFLDANSPYVAAVPGGVVRASETPPGKVAVVVGGGSGHYPAFCGVVGKGFEHGFGAAGLIRKQDGQGAFQGFEPVVVGAFVALGAVEERREVDQAGPGADELEVEQFLLRQHAGTLRANRPVSHGKNRQAGTCGGWPHRVRCPACSPATSTTSIRS